MSTQIQSKLLGLKFWVHLTSGGFAFDSANFEKFSYAHMGDRHEEVDAH